MLESSFIPYSFGYLIFLLLQFAFKTSFLKNTSSSSYIDFNRFERSIFISANKNHNHKKRKDSLEMRDKPAVICVYVENQATLEPILLYHASKYKQTKEQGSKDCLWTYIFTFLRDYYTLFFSFF